jgi:hypothetical protein
MKIPLLFIGKNTKIPLLVRLEIFSPNVGQKSALRILICSKSKICGAVRDGEQIVTLTRVCGLLENRCGATRPDVAPRRPHRPAGCEAVFSSVVLYSGGRGHQRSRVAGELILKNHHICARNT